MRCHHPAPLPNRKSCKKMPSSMSTPLSVRRADRARLKKEMAAIISPTSATPLVDVSNSFVSPPAKQSELPSEASPIHSAQQLQSAKNKSSDQPPPLPEPTSPARHAPPPTAPPATFGDSAEVLEHISNELQQIVHELGDGDIPQRLSRLREGATLHAARCRTAASGADDAPHAEQTIAPMRSAPPPPPPPHHQPSSPPRPTPADSGGNGRRGNAAVATVATPPPLVAQPSRSPSTPSYGETGVATSRLQARWRGQLFRRSALGRSVHQIRKRGHASRALLTSEIAYGERLHTLLSKLLAPLHAPLHQHSNAVETREGTTDATSVAEQLASFVALVQTLINLSRMLVAQLGAAANTPAAPSAAAASTLLALLPSYKCYTLYVASLASAQTMLASMRDADAAVASMLHAAECAAGESAASLLLAPTQRLPQYAECVERMLSLTPLDASERTAFCRALSAVHELVDRVNACLADHASRVKVVELAAVLAPALAAHTESIGGGGGGGGALSDGGLAAPHRRFLFDGPISELALDDARSEGSPRHAILFNDILIVLAREDGSEVACAEAPSDPLAALSSTISTMRVVECISLAKVQAKSLREHVRPNHASSGVASGGEGSAEGGCCAFELWSMAQIWRYAAPSAEARAAWVERLQAQIRCLLASFKQRGRSLAFLPQNVQQLRTQLQALSSEKRRVEQRVLQLTAEMSTLDERAHAERKQVPRLVRMARRSVVASGAELARHRAQLVELNEAARAHDARKQELQGETDGCVQKLYELSHALEAMDEQHNDEALLQAILFSAA